jgi:SnoaL-like domain
MTSTFDRDAALDAFRRGDTEALATHLAEDFTFAGPTPQPLPAAGFLGLARLLFTAFPDLDWRLEVSDITDVGFLVTTRTTGTHTGQFDLSALGFTVFEPTGRTFALPAQGFRWNHQNGRVVHIQAQPADGVGIPGILGQLHLLPVTTPAH